MRDFDAYERELWAGRAEAYERGFARLTACAIGPLLDAAGVGPGDRVLDLGTGPGLVSAEAVRRGAAVSAVDADPLMAATAARNVPEADVRVAVLPGLPYEDESFDAVVGNFVINHVGDPPAAMAELRRVLRPGGRSALTCWAMPDSGMPGIGMLGIVREAMERVGVAWPGDVPPSPFVTTYGRRETFAALLGREFTDAAVEPLNWTFDFEPGEWWESCALAGVGSTGLVLLRQDADTIAEVRRAYDQILTPFTDDDGHAEVPAHALLGHGAG